MGDERPSAYVEETDAGPRVVIRASAFGGASHVLAASLAGVNAIPFNAKTMQYMNEGVLHEPDILARVADETGMAWSVRRDAISTANADQEEMDFALTKNLIVRLHPDAFLFDRHLKPLYVVEAKAMSKDVFDKWNAVGFDYSYRYACQFSLEMLAAELPGVFAYKNGNTGEVKWKAYIDPPVSLAEMRKRGLKVWLAARRGDLDPYPDEKCSEYPCRFSFLHREPEVEVSVDEVIDDLAAMVDGFRVKRQAIERMEKDARGKLLMAIGDRGMVQTLRYKAEVVSPKPTQTLDKEKLVEVLGDLGPYMVSKEREPYVKVTGLRKEGDGDKG